MSAPAQIHIGTVDGALDIVPVVNLGWPSLFCMERGASSPYSGKDSGDPGGALKLWDALVNLRRVASYDGST